jgi:hypothetical protein
LAVAGGSGGSGGSSGGGSSSGGGGPGGLESPRRCVGTLSAESSAAVRSSSAAAIAITVSSHSIGAPRAVWRARGLVDGHHPWTDRGLTACQCHHRAAGDETPSAP